MGPAGDHELADLYGRSAVCVFPSLAEGFGLPPIEALSFGARVICSDIPVSMKF
jgi:glycosyltransferase involved in cell wall biosynthesis